MPIKKNEGTYIYALSQTTENAQIYVPKLPIQSKIDELVSESKRRMEARLAPSAEISPRAKINQTGNTVEIDSSCPVLDTITIKELQVKFKIPLTEILDELNKLDSKEEKEISPREELRQNEPEKTSTSSPLRKIENPIINLSESEMCEISASFLTQPGEDISYGRQRLEQKVSDAIPVPAGAEPKQHRKKKLNEMGELIETHSNSRFRLKLGNFWFKGLSVGIDFLTPVKTIISKFHNEVTSTKRDNTFYPIDQNTGLSTAKKPPIQTQPGFKKGKKIFYFSEQTGFSASET